MLRLKCHVQTYSWGVRGKESLVAQLKAAHDEDFVIEEKTPYAELWIGTHPSGEAQVLDDDKSGSLRDHIKTSDSTASLTSLKTNGKVEEDHLPFMMKVMSIDHSLSLQIHPTKEQAKYLHQKDPKNYPDANHKQELAFALNDFSLLCGWKPFEEICEALQDHAELAECLGGIDSAVDFINCRKPPLRESHLHRLVKQWLSEENQKRNAVIVAQLYEKLKCEFAKFILIFRSSATNTSDVLPSDHLFIRLYKQFPGDIGCIAAYLINHVQMKAGECCFYDNGVPHAYLEGDCIECVSCSNNTIRAAMSPKYRDIDSFTRMCDKIMGPGEDYLVRPTTRVISQERSTSTEDGIVIETFDTESNDFTLERIYVSIENEELRNQSGSLIATPSPSVMVIICGYVNLQIANDEESRESQTYRKGQVIYVKSEAEVQLTNVSNDLMMFRTYAPFC